MTKKSAIVLFSGGLDSTTCLAHARHQGFEVYALSIVYGQKHASEINAARNIAKNMNVKEHIIFDLPLIGKMGGSALTDENMAVSDAGKETAIPNTYVPARNTIFLSIALGIAEIKNAQDIYIGVSSVDYSGYPDCRPEYINAFAHLANLATKIGVEGNAFTLHTPLLYLTKAETIQLGLSLGVDYSQTVSCYRANAHGEACGSCDSCMLRKKGFMDAGLEDVTVYS